MESFNYSLGCLLFTLINYKINHRVYHESIPKTLAMNFGIITLAYFAVIQASFGLLYCKAWWKKLILVLAPVKILSREPCCMCHIVSEIYSI